MGKYSEVKKVLLFLTFLGISSCSVGEQDISSAFAAKASNIQVKGSGAVVKILADDNTGSRHQRFIIKVPTGQTVLIAHNIDLAQKIKTLKMGDTVEFYGEYEWNSKGGVVHWTHHDPNGHHTGGWLNHRGIKYE